MTISEIDPDDKARKLFNLLVKYSAWADGRDTIPRSYAVVKKGGIITTIVSQPDPAQLDKYGIRGTSIWSKPDGNELAGKGIQRSSRYCH